MSWKLDESFPIAESDWSAWRPPFGTKVTGERNVRRATRNWHPFDPLLISVPGATRMLPPNCFQEFTKILHRRLTFQYLGLLALVVVMCIGTLSAGFFLQASYFLKAGAAIALLSTLVLSQYLVIVRDYGRSREYARFVSWTYLQPYSNVLLAGLLLLTSGLLQWFGQSNAGSLFGFVEAFGLVFENAPTQPWRYFSGPFIHANVAHWASNASLLFVIAGLSSVMGRTLPLWVIFFFGTILPGVLLTFLPHWIGSDAFLGISGGIFALFGWCVGLGLRNRVFLPHSFWWMIGYFAIVTGIVGTLLDPRASWFAHGFGFFMGLFVGILEIGLRRTLIA